MSALRTINPATGKREKTFVPMNESEVALRLGRAARAFAEYRLTPLAQRSRWLAAAANVLEHRADEFAGLMTLEMGKLLKASRDEIKKCAWGCKHFAEHGARFLADEHIENPDAAATRVRFDPLGPILAIMPWNFPFWQVFRFAAPALMAGNVALLKHASNVPQCALAIESVFKEAGFPEGVFQTLLISSKDVAAVIRDPRVAAVSLTGSVDAGKSVAAEAGARIKKSVLELGGSDPFIVMPSANLEAAVKTGIEARIMNAGQSCVAAKRFILHESIAEEFEQRFVKGMWELKVGDPVNGDTQLGPMASEELLEKLDRQVQRSKDLGAEVLTGGMRLNRPGYYYAPTVLANIPKGSPAYEEELFGPVAAFFRARDAEDAVRIANDTHFGLGASVWTHDGKEQQFFSREIQAGNVFFNQKVASDPRLPFGGVKESGFGRELGVFGIREFVNIKTVWIARSEVRGGVPGQAGESELE